MKHSPLFSNCLLYRFLRLKSARCHGSLYSDSVSISVLQCNDTMGVLEEEVYRRRVQGIGS